MRHAAVIVLAMLVASTASGAEVWTQTGNYDVLRLDPDTGQHIGQFTPSKRVTLQLTAVGAEVWAPVDTVPDSFNDWDTTRFLRFSPTGQELGEHVYPFAVSRFPAVVGDEVWARKTGTNAIARFALDGTYLGDHSSPVLSAGGDNPLLAAVGNEVWAYRHRLEPFLDRNRVERFDASGNHLGGFNFETPPVVAYDQFPPLQPIGGRVWVRRTATTFARFDFTGALVDTVTLPEVAQHAVFAVGDEVWSGNNAGFIERFDTSGNGLGRYTLAGGQYGFGNRFTVVVPEPTATAAVVLVGAVLARRRPVRSARLVTRD